MSKIKSFNHLLISLFICLFAYLLIGTFSIAHAATVVQIQQLPAYINYKDFVLSCTTDGTTAQFYSKKDGGSYSAFGSTIDLTSGPCQVQVGSGQFQEDAKYWFEVVVDGVPGSTINNNETSTTLDTSGPGNVSNYSKERIGGGTVYRLHWTNPTESDYQRVFIYRGTTAGFESDGNKIAEAGGAPGQDMTYDDGGLDPSKEYYYYIRALDRANNSSGLIGDSATTTIYTTPTPGAAGKVTVLPKELGQGGGSVLGTEASPTPEETIAPTQGGVVDSINQFASQTPEPFRWILTHKKISLGLLIIIGIIGYYIYRANHK